MKIGYGTYGMPGEDIFAAIPRLRRIGYEALELAAAPDWPTAPERLALDDRQRLRAVIADAGFPPPVLLLLLSPSIRESATRAAMLADFDAACRLARDLNGSDASAIVTSTLGGHPPPWETGRSEIVADLVDLAEIAARYDAVLAIEPHVGGSLDRPEKASWLIREANHPNLRLNFDYSHFHVQGIDLRTCLDECLPHSVHAHIKDGRICDGKVVFSLPGSGDLDLAAYFRALAERGCTLPVCVEVSGMVWRRPDYDPWAAAEACYRALARGRSAARRVAGSANA